MRGVRFMVILAITLNSWSAAAAYPERPMRFIVAAVAGSSPDITSRLVTTDMTAELGQQFVVDNRGGAGGTISLVSGDERCATMAA